MTNTCELQSPVVGGTGTPMSLFHIDLGEARVMLDHIQSAVAKQGLQGKHITARAEIGDRKGMPETVGMAFLDARLLAQMVDHQA